MGTAEAILAAIIVNPQDDTPRLVYWLQENDDEAGRVHPRSVRPRPSTLAGRVAAATTTPEAAAGPVRRPREELGGDVRQMVPDRVGILAARVAPEFVLGDLGVEVLAAEQRNPLIGL